MHNSTGPLQKQDLQVINYEIEQISKKLDKLDVIATLLEEILNIIKEDSHEKE